MGKRRHWIVLTLVAAVTAAACSSQVSSGGSGIAWEGGPSWSDYCEGRRESCDEVGDACEEQEACARALLRDDIEPTLFQCLATTCDSDVCIAEIVAKFTPTPTGEAFRAAHQSFLAACPEGNDDVVIAAWIIADDRLDAFQACVEAPSCAESEACFDQVDATHIAVCEDWIQSRE